MKYNGMRVASASGNKHKVKEMESILKGFGIELIPKGETAAADVEIEETGETFEENSLLKAEGRMKITNMTAIADDSGLMVDALDGAPGVYSARFAAENMDENADDDKNNEKLMRLLKDVPKEKRKAKFVSVITMVTPDGEIISARGECPGEIGFSPVGTNGFGYDPLFIPDGFDVTYAQLTEDEKNKISHRSKALENLRLKLLNM